MFRNEVRTDHSRSHKVVDFGKIERTYQLLISYQ